jgi:tripartite-type tricarboxylate transporter receptor subunit TctC
MKRRLEIQLTFAVAAVVALLGNVHAYPEQPVRVVVPFGPGGGADITIRIMSEPLTAQLGQPIVVENRAGGSTIIGTDLVAKARPDGHTLLITTTTFTINPSLHAKLPYDSLKDLQPITLIASTPYVVVVHPSLPVRTIGDLLALARRSPNQLTYASTEMLSDRAGVKMVHVPYKGSAPAVNDLVGGHVSLYIGSMPGSMPQARAGKLRAIAVTSATRARAAPDLPTVAESGLPGYEFNSWYGLFAPGATPRAVVDRLHDAAGKVLAQPAVRERLAGDGNEPVGLAPDAFAATIKADMAKYARIVKSAKIRPD